MGINYNLVAVTADEIREAAYQQAATFSDATDGLIFAHYGPGIVTELQKQHGAKNLVLLAERVNNPKLYQDSYLAVPATVSSIFHSIIECNDAKPSEPYKVIKNRDCNPLLNMLALMMNARANSGKRPVITMDQYQHDGPASVRPNHYKVGDKTHIDHV